MDAIVNPATIHSENGKCTNSTETQCSISLEGIATAVPPFPMPQELVKAKAREILGDRYEDFARLSSIMQNAGIKKRYLSRPPVWFEGEHDFHGRNDAYLEVATDLFKQAALGTLKDAKFEPEDIDCIVTI